MLAVFLWAAVPKLLESSAGVANARHDEADRWRNRRSEQRKRYYKAIGAGRCFTGFSLLGGLDKTASDDVSTMCCTGPLRARKPALAPRP